MVLFTQFGLLLVGTRGEIGFPTRAEVDMPTPEAAKQRIGFCVVVGAEFAVFAVMCHNFGVKRG